ncbi:hypothetical protein ACCS91_24270 [Rhizobium ruizarguesonis]
MNQSVKRVFDVRPEYLKSDFLKHILTIGLPDTWAFITNEKPPADGIEVILQDFVISRHLITQYGRAPCSICSPNHPKYVKGHLLWSTESKALYAVGHCCGHGFFAEGTLARALTRNSNAERRRADEEFLERNWHIPRQLVQRWEKLKPTVRDLDKVLKAIRVGLTTPRSRDIHRALRDGGYLKIQELVSGVEGGPGGLTKMERQFGSTPVQGASVLRGGSRGISVEAKLSGVIHVLAGFGWQTQDDAILWICEQVDSDITLLSDFIREAVEGFNVAMGDISSLRDFLDAENLRLISEWSLQAHGRRGAVEIHNDCGHITILRGGKRHRNFRLPSTLSEILPEVPILL